MSKQVNRPSLQSFWKDRVVGVGTSAHADVPGLDVSRLKYASIWFTAHDRLKMCSHRFPPKFFLVNQDPHQLRNCHGWVGVIQLDGNLDMQNNRCKYRKVINWATTSGEPFLFQMLRVICFTLSGSLLKSVRAISLEPNLDTLKRRMMSCRVADTTKYSCFRRSSFPSKNYG